MNLRQCLHSMYSKHASSFLPSCTLWPWAGFLFHSNCSVYLKFLLYLSLCNCFPNCLIKYDYKEEEVKKEEELQISLAIISFSSSSKDMLLSPFPLFYFRGRSLLSTLSSKVGLHFQGSAMELRPTVFLTRMIFFYHYHGLIEIEHGGTALN